MACGADGAIYLVTLDSLNRTVGSGEHVVYAVEPDGSIRTIAKDFVKDKLPESDRHPEVRPEYCRGIAVDEKGNVYVAVTGNRCVMKLTQKGEASVVLKAENAKALEEQARLRDEVRRMGGGSPRARNRPGRGVGLTVQG